MILKKIGKNIYVLLFAIIFFLLLVSCSEETYLTTDINEYMQLEGHIENESLMYYDTGFFIFPEDLERLKDVEYMHYCKAAVLDNTYVVYLKGYYEDEQQFNDEIERLADITCTIKLPEGDVINKVQYSETLFDHPAYMTIYDKNLSYEYALIDATNRCITYVFFSSLYDMDILDSHCLPKEIQEAGKFDYDTTWRKHNIYFAEDKEEAGVYWYYNE